MTPRNRRIFPMWVFILFAAVLISACATSPAGEPPAGSASGSETTTDSAQIVQLDCEAQGYPCSVAEVGPQVLEDSQRALDDAVALIEEGGSIEDAAAMLQDRGDLAELIYEPEGIRFRLEGGTPMWVINAAAVVVGGKAPGAGKDPSAAQPGEPALPILQGGSDDGPIGESERGEEPYKKALLLSPFWWDFEGDETEVLKALLEKSHRNYSCEKCQVDLKKNTIPAQTEGETEEDYFLNQTFNIDYGVSLADFQNWDQYDLIHVSTHGTQICRDGSCEAMLMTGQFLDADNYLEAAEIFSPSPGISWGKLAVPGCSILRDEAQDTSKTEAERQEAGETWVNKGCGTFTNRYWQLVEPDFFINTYYLTNKSLDDKLIFFSACESMKDLSLAKAVSGDNTTVYGWTESVDAGSGGNVAIKFYEMYVVGALRAEVAFDKVKNLAADEENSPVLRRYRPKGIEIEALLPPEFEQEGEENTRGREIITIMQPIYREELSERGALPTNGIAGDGEDDQLLFQVQIDGIDEQQDPNQFTIHLAVDGEELEKTFLPREKVGDYSYTVIDMVDLPFDAAEREFVELEAWVDLPEGGESRHVLEEVELASCGWTGTMSGARSGDVQGEIVIPTDHMASIDLEELMSLAGPDALGPLGDGGAGMPSPSQLENLPFGLFLVHRDTYPSFILIPGYGATGILGQTTLASGQQASLSLTVDSQERKEGGFSASMVDLASQSDFSVQGDLYWHIESVCSLKVIMEIARNPLPANITP